MKVVPPAEEPPRNREGLQAFLTRVHEQAFRSGVPCLASISLRVRHIAPLAVLQSIFEPDERHAYFEHPQADCAVAAAEAACEATFSGEGRFEEARAFAEACLARSVCIGDLDTPFSGIHFFCAFDFDDEAPGNVPTGRVFVPRWQVARQGGDYVAVANALIEPSTQVPALLEKIWAAYQRFSAYDYGQVSGLAKAESQADSFSPLPEQPYSRWVERALADIAQGRYEKLVLARALDISLSGAHSPFSCLDRLRTRYAGCFTYSWAEGDAASFIGATPECLCRVRNCSLYTEALAGSAPRGRTPAEDAAFASGLLASEKDAREHAIVRDMLLSLLHEHGIEARADGAIRLRQLANVQHLLTPVCGKLCTPRHVLEVARWLHPTPAVAGHPRVAACSAIAQIERVPRGLYSGTLGWFNARGEGEMLVALRCAYLRGSQARLFAGAGIVAGSEPEKEMRETALKLAALQEALEQT